MINREDMLELTRRMTPSRTSFTRVAGGYMEPDGEIDESFNVNFLNLSAAEKEKNLAIAKAVPFAATNVNLRSYAFGDGAEQRKMRQLLYGMRECGLKNDALLYTFYELVGACMCIDDKGNIWVADFSANAVARVDKDGKIQRIAQSPDCDGSDGGLDQPGEPIVWNGQVIVSCFDLVTGPDKVNTKHDKPFTLAKLSLEEKK